MNAYAYICAGHVAIFEKKFHESSFATGFICLFDFLGLIEMDTTAAAIANCRLALCVGSRGNRGGRRRSKITNTDLRWAVFL